MYSEDFQFIGFWIRALAFLVDHSLGLIVAVSTGTVIFTALGYGWGSPEPWTRDPSTTEIVMVSIIGAVEYYLYFILLTGFNNGQTFGKMLFRIQMVDKNGVPANIGRAILRETLAKMVSGPFGYLWVAWLLNEKKRGWHDYIAGTYVIRKRSSPG